MFIWPRAEIDDLVFQEQGQAQEQVLATGWESFLHWVAMIIEL
jgi:hypothetical protein